jgi:hypothetical protein
MIRSADKAAKSVCLLLACWAVWRTEAHATDFCVKDPQVEVVDTSAPVHQSFLSQMKAIGINTIIRYYDHEDETLPGKTLRRAERDAIVMNGFKLGVVFQHRKIDSPRSPRCAAARTPRAVSSSLLKMANRGAAPFISEWMAHGTRPMNWPTSWTISER